MGDIPLLGEIAALTTACCWSVTALAFASATRRVGSVQVNITRLILASVLLLSVIALFGYSLRVSSAQLVLLAISGILGLVFGDSFLFQAFQEIGARISMLIMSLAPAFSALLAWIMLNETLSWYGITGIAITISGIGLVVSERREEKRTRALSVRGVFYALLASIGQGIGLVFARMAFDLGAINGFSAAFIRIAASLVLLIPLMTAVGKYRNPVKILSRDRRALLFIAVGATFGPFIGITLSLVAISHTAVGIAATIMAMVPVLMLPLVRFLYQERLTMRAITGACVAVAGVGLLFLTAGL